MASTSDQSLLSNANLSSITSKIEYKEYIPYLPDTLGVHINIFNTSSLSEMYYLDTSHVVTKTKRLNCKCLYDTFGEYVDLPGTKMKELAVAEIKQNRALYNRVGRCSLGMCGMNFKKWLDKLPKP